MAERPSVEEILARVRAAGPARPAEESAAEPAPTPAGPAAPEPSAVAPEPTPAPTPAAPPPPSPSTLGRPLTLKEKLAAARGRPAGAEPAAAAPPPPAPPAVEPAGEAPAVAAEAASSAPPASANPQLTPEALGRPLTLKEKLAAARSGGGAAAPAAPGSRPAAKPAAGAAPAAAARAASTRPLPPLEQMSDPKDLAEALRRAGAEKEKKAKAAVAEKGGAAAKAAPNRAESKVVPPRPGREAAEATPPSEPGVAAGAAPVPGRVAGLAGATRRQLMRVGFWIAAGWLAFVGGLGAFIAMSARFMFPNVLAEPPSTIKVGLPTNFEKGEVNETWKAEWGFWIVRSDNYDGEDKLYALSSTCTHLGCPPNWLAGEQKFKCPCHGSGFYVSGVNFEGPAPRPLERFKISVGDDGQLVVDKSAKFQEELGQWKDPESYVVA